MKIAVLGPIATRDIAPLLESTSELPEGYTGAPLVTTLIRELLRRDHDVVAVTTDMRAGLPRGRPAMARGHRLKYYVCSSRRRAYRPNGWRPGRILDLYRDERAEILRVLAFERPDVVHAHWSYEFGWAAVDSGLPHLVTCHDSPWQVLRHLPNAYRLGRLLMARRVLGRARRMTTVSDYMREELKGFAGVVAEVVPNPVDSVEGVRPRELLTGAGISSPFRIGMVLNGWGGRKNGPNGLEAFRRARERLPRAELHLFGFGCGPKEAAQRWASKKCADGVVFHGAVEHERMLKEMVAFDILLHPAREESFGMVIVEAQIRGVPVIGGRASGAVPWLLERGSSGILVDVESPEEMANSICALSADPSRYAQLSRAGLRSAHLRFTVGAVVDSFEEIYDDLLRFPAGDASRQADSLFVRNLSVSGSD